MHSLLRLLAIFTACILLSACHHRPKTISFYYWRTTFTLDSLEKAALRDNSVNTLYVRYFDVDFAPGDPAPKPVSPLALDTIMRTWRITPVIFLRNRVFERLDTAGITSLASNVHSLVSAMNDSLQIKINEIQFDCDWTERTSNKYFLFLRQYRTLTAPTQLISATIRLHQVKYPGKTGIPPVDNGVLMYYNMGDINPGTQRSIYERSVALRYIPSLKSYPLTLDVALPIFAWGLQIREGKVIQLLNKMYFTHFENDSNFTVLMKDRYSARHACFKGGYYFQEGDMVKIEHIPENDLLDMITDINRYSNHHIRNLIFYELDKANLIQYEKNLFTKVLDHTD